MIQSLSKLFASVFGHGGNASAHTCPECGSNLIDQSCPNPDCPVQIRRILAHWCSPEAMNIAGIDDALVAKMVKVGLARDVAELYLLKVGEAMDLEGVNEASARQLIAAIAASKKRDMWHALYGLGIPEVSADAAQALGRDFEKLDDALDAPFERLMAVKGIREATAQSILQWWGDPVNRRLIKRLHKHGLNFQSELFR